MSPPQASTACRILLVDFFFTLP